MIRRTILWSLLGAAGALVSLTGAAPGLAYVNWPTYQFDAGHSSLNGAARTITPLNVHALSRAWSQPFMPTKSGFTGSPVVYNGSIYLGDNNGTFYRLNEATGAIIKRLTIGRENTCGLGQSGYGYGIEDTATVAPDPSRGGAPTVYVTGGNGRPDATGVDGKGGIYLWALDARTLKRVWRTDPVPVTTQAGATGWASPVVSHRTISVGIASGCDAPEVQGGLRAFSQSSGAPVSSYWTVPAGNLGGPIWATPVTSGSSTWVATGNAEPGSVSGDSYSIVRLHGGTKVDSWTVPGITPNVDDDFGDSPTLFTALLGTAPTSMIGDCNKNGTFYALRSMSLSSGPVWTYQLGIPNDDTLCSSGAVWDARAHELIVGGTKNQNGEPGSIQALAPGTGAVIWRSYLPCPVEGPPSEDGAGVLAVVTYNGGAGNPCSPGAKPSLYLYDAHSTVSSGSAAPAPRLLKTISLGVSAFSQPIFADGYLLVAGDGNGNLMAYATVTSAQIRADLRRRLAPVGRAARISELLKKHGYTFRFKTLSGGTLKIAWYSQTGRRRGGTKGQPVRIAVGHARFSKAGVVKVTITLTRVAARMFKSVKRMTLIADATYQPKGLAAVTITKKFTLRR